MPSYFQNPQPLFQLSQSHLSCLTTCPRKFQYVYLDQLSSPAPTGQQSRQDLGSRFHWLMQQQALGLSIARFVQADPALQPWFQAFDQAPPAMVAGERLSEYRQSLVWDKYLLVAVYDLLILGEQQAQILDWKTYARPQRLRSLQQSWQTRLYPFILAEASHYRPDQIAMTYWFAEAKGQDHSHSLTFAYSEALHEQTRRDLTHLLQNLTEWLRAYRQKETLPQVEIAAGHCQHATTPCGFAVRCQRHPEAAAALPVDLGIIAEVPL
jgi:hypothetical protein